MKAPGICALGFMLGATAAASALASSISLDVRPASEFRHGQVRVTATLVNRGDEPALAVWMEAGVAGRSTHSVPVERVEASDSCRFDMTLGDAPLLPGVYTVIVRTHYTDLNGFPFCAVTSIPLTTGEPAPAPNPLSAKLSSVLLRRQGIMTLTVRNAGAEPAGFDAELVLPDELRVSPRVGRLTLGPAAETNLTFTVTNFGAWPGCRYPVFAVIDSSGESGHRSFTATGSVVVPPWWSSAWRLVRRWAWLIVALLSAAFLASQFLGRSRWPPPAPEPPRWGDRVLPPLVLLAILAFTLGHIPPSLLLLDTMTVGGDTPAHNYLASQLKQHLFGHGRIVSWSDGWWSGFPLFQFYFCLPYLVIAVLSSAIPFNVAFKLVSVSGILLLPAAAYGAGRRMHLPRPAPALLAVATVPFLFDHSHTMWGGNIYSTFAGMISNSASLPIMLLFLASAFRDADDGIFRVRTVLWLVALLASHFFTSVVAALTLAILPLLRLRNGRLRALAVLSAEGAMGLLLMAWWIIPLIAKGPYSMDFGTDWDVRLSESLPRFALLISPLAVAALLLAVRKRLTPVLLLGWMLAVSAALFRVGTRVSPVFVNVRLWPFVFLSLLSLAAIGLGLLIGDRRGKGWIVAAAAVAAFTYGIGAPNHVRDWAEFNYQGLERKPNWPVFERLVLPLRGTAGRLANDLHEHNQSLGSSRIFESVPHLIGKPILEGGLVNSAVGSMFSYYVQGEASENSAGFPTIVEPAAFNWTNASRHLALFNVKHFIAKWSGTREALARDPAWTKLAECRGWELYERLGHDDGYVTIPPNDPIPVRTPRWKEAGLQWIYTPAMLDHPFILLDRNEASDESLGPCLTEEAFLQRLASIRSGAGPSAAGGSTPAPSAIVREEEVSAWRIRFRTGAIGRPHLIKCTYYPNWKVRGAKRVYRVTPCFMLVYPEQEEVELYYGYTLADNVGRSVSALALMALIAHTWRAGRRKGKLRSDRPREA